jgi:hypothetical protein
MEKEQVIKSMSADDMDKFSDEQLRQAQGVFLKRLTRKARDIVRESLVGKEEEIVRALTTPPFAYTTPDIKISPGCTIRLQSLNNDQVVDAYRQVDDFMRREDANNLRVSNELNMALLSHSLVKMNGSDFGGVDSAENYHELVRDDPKAARAMLAEIRDKRRAALGAMPMPITSRLIEFYLAFQTAVDSAANGENVGDLLGK